MKEYSSLFSRVTLVKSRLKLLHTVSCCVRTRATFYEKFRNIY